MGNAESSSEFPPSPVGDDGFGRRGSEWSREKRKAATDQEEEGAASSSSTATALKVGAAVAGGALLALGALSLSSSSSSRSDDSDDRRAVRLESKDGGGSGYASNDGYQRLSRNSRPNAGDSYHQSASRPIKIMTYNVWFNEELEMEERMDAIGKLIKHYSPDIIFFQELSKLPVINEFICKGFENSTMGRELCGAMINAGAGKKLFVATSHLESPTPPAMHSTERVAQAEEVLDRLSSLPNVIFGGDMNWDENNDGHFPLPDGWFDAWSNLRPDEDGWTYDTKSNGMLKGYRPLQKRLDRFVCKLRDFRMVSVDMIGMAAIPGLSGYNFKGKLVPVLPSDHYGLLLAISSI